MFAGIYYGGMYGGSTTAILINTPGESASMATALEGNLMAKAGRGGPALATSAIGSFVAGTIATLGLTLLAPYLVEIAVSFGPEDYFALMVVAFVTVSATFGDSPVRGLTSLFIGLGHTPYHGCGGVILGGHYYAYGWGWIDGCIDYGSRRIWVPGFYAPYTVEECYSVPVWVPPVYEEVWTGCCWETVMVDGGYFSPYGGSGCHYVTRYAWVPGHWDYYWV